MTKRLAIFIFIFSFFSRLIQAQSPHYEHKIIEKIDVVVASPDMQTFESNTAHSRMKTKEGQYFSQTEFDSDLKTLAQDFDRVDPSIEMIDQKIYITMKVWLKPTIRRINWEGNHKVTSQELENELGIRPGLVFDRQSFNKAFHKVKAYYVKNGFFEAQLNLSLELDSTTNEIDISIQIEEGRAGKIKKVIFKGLDSDVVSDLCEMIITKEYNLYTSWLSGEGVYNEEAMQQDQFLILNYLQNKGYADAQVSIRICEAPEPLHPVLFPESNRIVIYIDADTGPIYQFGALTFEGNHLFSKEDIEKRFTIFEGEHYSPEAVRETAQRIMSFYGRRGYIDTIVNFEPKLEMEGYAYSVHFTIEEGEQFRVGLIKVFGNGATQTNVILHETLLIPGEIFNNDKLEKTEERLQNIGFFKNVNVYAVKSEGPGSLGGNYRDVHIEVEETSTGHFGAFAGFSTIESLFGGFNITERNFNYLGLSRLFIDGMGGLRGGGEYAHFTATIGKRSRSYILSWTKPFWNDTQWSVGFELERSSNRYISHDYDIEANGLTLHATYQYNPFLKTGWHYRLRHTNVHIHGEETEDLRRQSKEAGIVSAVGTSLVYDSTDHPSRPSNGFKSRLEAEMAGLGGHHRFFALAYLNNYYYQTNRQGVLKFRADVRFVVPYGGTDRLTIPLDERLFLGGDTQIRGYRSYKLGPKFDNGDPSGGLSMQLASIEYEYRLSKRLDGFLFVDAGHLSNRNFDFFGHFYASTGVGCRLKIFDGVPPLTFGFGFPLNPRTRGEVKKFFLQVGGKF